MNDIERQILKNQVSIMCVQRDSLEEERGNFLQGDIDDTLDLLNPPEQQSIAERTHDALSEDTATEAKNE